MRILRIRRAEVALKDGRLDEAFELLSSDEVQAHRTGQKLIGRLARALTERGQSHLEADRVQQAAADCEKAAKLAGNLTDIADLRLELAKKVEQRTRDDRRKHAAIEAARDHIDNGRLTIGMQMMDGLSGERQSMMQRDIETRRACIESAIARVDAAIGREDWRSAVEDLIEARTLQPKNDQVTTRVADLSRRIVQDVRKALAEGRLDRAEHWLPELTKLAGETVDVRECQKILTQCGRVAQALGAGRPREALEALTRIRTLMPEASWVADAVKHVEHAAQAIEHVLSGPIGLISDDREPIATAVTPAKSPDMAETIGMPAPVNETGPELPGRFMLHVDGVGAFFVVRDARVNIGPASSSGGADVGLQIARDVPPVTIERSDEDYFITSNVNMMINDQPASRKLLVNGDRVQLAERCRLRFIKPNPASPSVLLNLSGARLARGEARSVVLMADSLILGAASSAHIRTAIPSNAVLYARDGKLGCRCDMPVMVDDHAIDAKKGLPIGKRIRIGELSFTVQPV